MRDENTITIGSRTISTRDLEQQSEKFFKRFGTQKLLGKSVFGSFPKNKHWLAFDDLLAGCGYRDNPADFFNTLISGVFTEKKHPVTVNGIRIPLLFLYHLLEALSPGRRLHHIKRTGQLENLGISVPEKDRANLQQVMDLYPVRLSDHIIRQARVSGKVAGQYLPFVRELDTTGDAITFDGHLKHGVLEQMYENRVIFLLDMRCPVFCRFCFRKHKADRKDKTPTVADVRAAVDHVRLNPALKEILITGGEPLLNLPNLEAALDGLGTIKQVNVIRIATRSVAYYPDLLSGNNNTYVQYLVEKNRELNRLGKRIEIGVHFVHPDEISIQSLNIISELVNNGIQVYVQTPFLNSLNTDGRDLARLFTLLRNAGAGIYYIFTPCSPIHGTKPFWAPVSDAVRAMDYLRDHLSDRCLPKLCTATPLGKIEWDTSGWAVEKDSEDPEFIWIRTPYTRHYYQRFVHHEKELPRFRENPEGTLDARFRVDMGSDDLFCGSRLLRCKESTPIRERENKPDQKAVLAALVDLPDLNPTVVPVPVNTMSRVHTAVLEMTPAAGRDAYDYLCDHPSVTDVILHADDRALADLDLLVNEIGQIKNTGYVTCVRLCCRGFNTCPQLFTHALVEQLARVSNVSIADSFRIEVETWFLTPEEINTRHEKAARALISRGIGIYANLPLIRGVNDDPDTMVSVADRLREACIEFHHLYVDGLDIQKRFNPNGPLPDDRLIDIASHIRRSCSGRQIPLYVVRTPEGERPADFTRQFTAEF